MHNSAQFSAYFPYIAVAVHGINYMPESVPVRFFPVFERLIADAIG
jgi:hypothetical protein